MTDNEIMAVKIFAFKENFMAYYSYNHGDFFMKTSIFKLDRSSLFLILIALLGIGWSLSSLFLMNHDDTSRGEKRIIARVTQYKQDTRLKRSGDLHWFKVNQSLDCFVSDSVFTGADSFATVEFLDGSSVTLYPNSLISLDEGHVALNSGTIDVNLEKGGLSVESFGETFKVQEKGKFRLENTATSKKIVPLTEMKNSLGNDPRMKGFVQTETLALNSPAAGETKAKFPGTLIEFGWRSSTKSSSRLFKLEFSNDENFGQIQHSLETVFSAIKVPVDKLPTGLVHWRVTEKSGPKGHSSFFLTDDLKVELFAPAPGTRHPYKLSNQTGITFEWANTLKLPQKLQIARDGNMQELVIDEAVNSTSKVAKFHQSGKYFWRVGYTSQNAAIWSEVRSFDVAPDVVFAPMRIAQIPNPLDFSLVSSYLIQVTDPNHCDTYLFTLMKDGKVLSEVSSKQPVYKLTRLTDGNYTIVVKGVHTKHEIEGETSKLLVVKNSPPLEAPKIKKKNVKLFVQALRFLSDLIFPSASAAAPKYFYKLEWEALPGATYELEIARGQERQIIQRESLTENHYKFFIPGPENYYWRVRVSKDGRWGPFTEYAEIMVQDKIMLYKKPLMKTPPHRQAVKMKTSRPEIKLTWNEPFPRAKYFLEIYSHPKKKPLKTLQVKKGEQVVQFKQVPKRFFWRVYGQSQYNNQTANEEKFQTDIIPDDQSFWPKGDYLARFAAFPSKANLKVDSASQNVTEDVDLTGAMADFNFEFFPKRYRNNSFNFSFRYMTASSGDSELQEQKLGAEMGFRLKNDSPSLHMVYLSYYLVRQFDFNLGTDVEATYSASFVGSRYLYRKPLSEKTKLELNAGVQIPAAINFTPSIILRPGLNYQLSKKWWLDSFLLLERYFTKPEVTGQGDDAEVTLMNMGAGLGFTWRPGGALF
jgi:hypothetical protein